MLGGRGGEQTKKFFAGKKFYLYVRRTSTNKVVRFIKIFGGQIEQFLDNEVSYVLTDVPKNEWPPNGRDAILERAVEYSRLGEQRSCKLMSLNDLLVWCKKYVSSQSSSDDEDDTANELKSPFIKFEDKDYRFAPTVIELTHRTESNLNPNLPIGQPLLINTPIRYPDNGGAETPCAEITQQQQTPSRTAPNSAANLPSNAILGASPIASPVNSRTQPNNHTNNTAQKGFFKRKNNPYCELCNIRINVKVEEHVETPVHKANVEKQDWGEVISVIDSLPSLSTLNMRRITNLTPTHAEFLCLHKVESVSQLFQSK